MLIIGRLIIFIPLAIICLAVCLVFFYKVRKIKKIDVCSDCGNILNDSDKMCQKCGNPIPNIDNQRIIYYVIIAISVIGFLYSCIRILRGVGIVFNIILN